MAGEHLLDELGRFDGDAEILQAWRDGMAPEPALLVSEWADRHRMLGSRDSAEPGPYRTARTPYLREVMDALVEGKANKVIAFDLGISARTVEVYRANVMEKLGVFSFADALRIAFAAGLGSQKNWLEAHTLIVPRGRD